MILQLLVSLLFLSSISDCDADVACFHQSAPVIQRSGSQLQDALVRDVHSD